MCEVCKSETTKTRTERDPFIPIGSTNKMFHLMRLLSCHGVIVAFVKKQLLPSRTPGHILGS